MFNSVSDWICNVILWGAILSIAALFYETFQSPGFLASQVGIVAVLLAIGIVAVLSSLWPKY